MDFFFSYLLPFAFFFKLGHICQSCDLLARRTVLTHQVKFCVTRCVPIVVPCVSFQAILGLAPNFKYTHTPTSSFLFLLCHACVVRVCVNDTLLSLTGCCDTDTYCTSGRDWSTQCNLISDCVKQSPWYLLNSVRSFLCEWYNDMSRI